MSRNDTKKAEFEAAVESVFGSDDGASRRELLTLAKNGAFVEALGILNRKPHLINTQSHISGWTVLHQAAFHGCSRVLFGRLLTSGACPRLRGYFDGRTPLDVLQEPTPTTRRSPTCASARATAPATAPRRTPLRSSTARPSRALTRPPRRWCAARCDGWTVRLAR